jgi:hypothetical protein
LDEINGGEVNQRRGVLAKNFDGTNSNASKQVFEGGGNISRLGRGGWMVTSSTP